MKKILLISILVISFTASAQEEIINRSFLPSEFFVGDTVEMRLVVSGPDAEKLSPPEIPTMDWGIIKSIQKKSSGSGVIFSIIFIPYQPGRHYIPAISFGEYILEEQEVIVSSLYNLGYTQPEPYRPVLISGRVKIFIVFALFILFFVLSLLAVLIKDRFRIIRRFVLFLRLSIAKRLMLSRLKKLAKSIDLLSRRDFFDSLVSVLRDFMYRFLLIDIRAMTSREILCIIKQSDIEIDESSVDIILSTADMVKFAHKDTDDTECSHALNELMTIIKKHKISIDNAFLEEYGR